MCSFMLFIHRSTNLHLLFTICQQQQGNLRAFTVNNKTASLLSLWIDAVYDIVGRVNTLPVLTYKLDDLEGVYRARMQRDECGIEGKLTYMDGMPHHIDVSSASKVWNH